MEIQKSILLFFSSIDSKFLDKLVEFITMFGESVVPLIVGLFLIWCVDKKKGVLSTITLLTACSFMSALKAIVRFPRPWKVIPELQTQRISTATGYSFPSGHSTTAASFYSSIAYQFKKRKISIICAIIILLVPISRMYLCVHWPLDVFCGTVLGIGTTMILLNKLTFIYDNRVKYYRQIIVVGSILAASGFVMAILVQAGKIDLTAFDDFAKVLALLGGVLIGFAVEEKYCNFSTDGTWKQKVLRYVVGAVVALFFLEGVKLFTPHISVISFLRYFAVGLWSSMYPMVGKKLGLFN